MMLETSTPRLRMSAAIRRPKGLSGSLLNHETECPSAASATAVLDSLPPTFSSRESADSRRWNPGGFRRIIVSPKVTTLAIQFSHSVRNLFGMLAEVDLGEDPPQESVLV